MYKCLSNYITHALVKNDEQFVNSLLNSNNIEHIRYVAKFGNDHHRDWIMEKYWDDSNLMYIIANCGNVQQCEKLSTHVHHFIQSTAHNRLNSEHQWMSICHYW